MIQRWKTLQLRRTDHCGQTRLQDGRTPEEHSCATIRTTCHIANIQQRWGDALEHRLPLVLYWRDIELTREGLGVHRVVPSSVSFF